MPDSPIQIQSPFGAGLSERPCEETYQYAVAVSAIPHIAAHGTQRLCQRLIPQQIAATNAMPAMIWIVMGIQPCIKDR